MIAIGGVIAMLVFVGVLFYLDGRTRKRMGRQNNAQH